MALQKFEDIIAWQKAQEFAVDIYSALNECKDFSFRDQICIAVVSISNNIAEEFDRSSNADFSRFLYSAIGSCSEVKSMLCLATKLKYISNKDSEELIVKVNDI